MDIRRTAEFAAWLSSQSLKEQGIVEARLSRIADEHHFGDAKYLGEGLAELRWKNGRRIYFYRADEQTIVILWGGLKNAQKKDIKKARLLLRRHASDGH